jgi:uncharacterized protein DUF4349
MTGFPQLFAIRRRGWRRPSRHAAVLAAAAIAGGACLLAAGCSAGSATSAGEATGAGSAAHKAAGVPRALAGSAAVPAPAGRNGLAAGGSAAGQPVISTQQIIYTASLTVGVKDVRAAASRASRLATAAGGYVASENVTVDRAHPASATVSLRVKIPVVAYQGTLSSLSQLGTPLSQSERAQDVTQTVANVASRVASARAGIRQLRALLAHAGSVQSLLTVQERINQEESDLEALQSQQRALGHETAFGTISLLFVRTGTHAARHHHRVTTAGFLPGLAAGWRALRSSVSWLLTGVGAVLPFALPLAAAAALGYQGRRWWGRRRAGTRPAG